MGYLPELDKSISKFVTMSKDEYTNKELEEILQQKKEIYNMNEPTKHFVSKGQFNRTVIYGGQRW